MPVVVVAMPMPMTPASHRTGYGRIEQGRPNMRIAARIEQTARPSASDRRERHDSHHGEKEKQSSSTHCYAFHGHKWLLNQKHLIIAIACRRFLG
jgi:hypothetical protein